jgi:hypothetical protein
LACAELRATTSRSEEKTEMNLPNFPEVDLFSAGINALYGVLVARQPSHNRGYTAAGLLICSGALAVDRASRHARRRPGRARVNAFSRRPLVSTWFCRHWTLEV